MEFYKIPGTVRASFAFYNTKEEIDVFIKGHQPKRVRSLREKEKEKDFTKKNSPRMLLLAGSSFAIDAQHAGRI